MVVRNLSAQFPESGDYCQLGGIRMDFMNGMACVMALKGGVRFAQVKLEGIPG